MVCHGIWKCPSKYMLKKQMVSFRNLFDLQEGPHHVCISSLRFLFWAISSFARWWQLKHLGNFHPKNLGFHDPI